MFLQRNSTKRNSTERKKIQSMHAHIEGWLSDEVADLLFETARRLSGAGCIVEIGSWKGKSTLCLAEGSMRGSQVPVYAIDPHTGSQEHHHLAGNESVDTFSEFSANVSKSGLSDLIHPLRKTSAEAAVDFEEPVELLWIDGSHDYQDVLADYENWFPKLVPGGWILFHDSKWQGVREVLWQKIFPNRELGLIRRMEDTTYAQKRPSQGPLVYGANLALLRLEQQKQTLKRSKRRFRKKIRRLKTTFTATY